MEMYIYLEKFQKIIYISRQLQNYGNLQAHLQKIKYIV